MGMAILSNIKFDPNILLNKSCYSFHLLESCIKSLSIIHEVQKLTFRPTTRNFLKTLNSKLKKCSLYK